MARINITVARGKRVGEGNVEENIPNVLMTILKYHFTGLGTHAKSIMACLLAPL